MWLLICAESRVVKGHVTRRSDDPHGQGFGNVKTGFVSSTKLSFLQQAVALDRDASPSPSLGSSSGGRTKGLRVTWAESPGSSRPASNLGWADGMGGAAAARAQTPPLAGEWASGGGAAAATVTSQSRISSSSSSLVQQQQAQGQVSLLPIRAREVAADSGGTTVNSATSYQSAQQMSFQSSQQMSASSFQSAKQMSSSFSSAKSSSSFQMSSSIQSGKMHTFEAFPGLGEIENLCLEQGERVGK